MTPLSSGTDSIHLEQLELDARVGVTGEERARPQRLVISVSIWPKTAFDQLQDDIARTVNYVELGRAAREFVQSRDWKLIETIAYELVSHLLDHFPLKTAEIEVRKFVLPNTQYVSAIVRRDATG